MLIVKLEDAEIVSGKVRDEPVFLIRNGREHVDQLNPYLDSTLLVCNLRMAALPDGALPSEKPSRQKAEE